MFTGIIERVGRVGSLQPSEAGARLEVLAPGWLADPRPGESIAVNGTCLTLVAHHEGALRFDAVPQTLDRTTTGSLRAGDAVNLERALRADALLGGHLVQGHVEGVGSVVGVDRSGGGWRTRIAASAELLEMVIDRGSVAVDGVSLTVAATGPGWFEVALIPETLERTTLASRLEGARVNIEPDLFARLVAAEVRRQLARQRGG
jgi:riboflavin synthase